MQLTFRDLKQNSFHIDAEPSDTIAEVKSKVAAERQIEAGQLKLIWSGKIMADANTVESYNISPTGYIVCMVQKPKAAPAPKSPSTPAITSAQTPSAPAPASNPSIDNAPATPSPAPATTATRQPVTERNFSDTAPIMLGPERQAAVANLESMGFPRAECERAMRAAFYNPDRAVEYLINGIPENAQPEPSAARTSGARAHTPATPATETTAPSTPAPAADSDEPVNLFEAAAAANQGNRVGATGARGAGAATRTGTGAGGAGAGAGAIGGAGNLDFLRENPTFQHLRQLVQQQPQMLESVLQQVGASNPQLAQLIASNPEQFLQMLSEGEEGEGVPLPPGAQNISVTEEERDAIERLCRLGFERDLVIQAYFACDKNEELAANFLFDHPDDTEEA